MAGQPPAISRGRVVLFVLDAAVYDISLILLGAVIPKAAAVTDLATLCAVIGYGTRWIYRLGFGLTILVVLVSVNVLRPAPSLMSFLNQMIGRLATKQ